MNALEAKFVELRDTHIAYMQALKAVVDLGDDAVVALTARIDDKFAIPFATALGLLAHRPNFDVAVPKLLSWLEEPTPMYVESLNALRRAGDRILSNLIDALRSAIAKSDDFAVRQFLYLGTELTQECYPALISVIRQILLHPSPHLRECGADAAAKIGLPFASELIPLLRTILTTDSPEHLKVSVAQTLKRLGAGI